MFLKTLNRLRRQWCADTSGVVAMVVVFCLPAFIAAAGVAVDLAQAYNIKTRLSAALDKAALAAGNTNGTPAEVQARIDAFLLANYPAAALGEAYDINVLTPPGIVDIHAHAKVKTVFMNIFGQEYIDVFAETIVKKEVSGLELVLVLDTTGSMLETAGGGVTKIDAAKTASKTLLDILYGSASNVPKLYVGIVPFSQNVNVGTQYTSFVNADSFNWGPTSWAGCVEARYTANDINVVTPATTKFNKYYNPCSSSNLWYWTVSSTEQATNGNFGAATGWTLGSEWSIGSGVATKVATPTNIATNGDFSSSGGWTLGNNWSIGSGIMSKVTAPDLSVNGTFSSSTGWTFGSGWAIASGLLSKTNSTTTSSTTRTPSVALIDGYDYEVVFTVSARTAGGVRATVGGTAGTTRSSNGTFTETITAGSGTTIGFTTSNGFRGSIDNFTIRQLESASYRTPSSALVAGDQYEVVFTVSSRTNGGVRVDVGGTLGTTRSSNGTFTETIVAGSGTTIGFYSSNNFVGNIDNFTIRNISTSRIYRTAASTLDSSADYLVTYTINSITAGSVRASVGGANGSYFSTAGTHEEVINAGSSNQLLQLTSSGFEGVIDNFSVKQLSSCGNGPTYHYFATLDEAKGPNKACSKPLLEMTSEKADLVSKIDSLTAQGSTMIHLGMAWGWRMLDPSWQSQWTGTMAAATSPGPLPLGYNTSGMNKAVILMTDGDNTFTTYSAYGSSSSNVTYSSCSYGSNPEDKFDCKTRDICTNMKAQNILIYTIALGTDLSTSSKDMLKTCATSPAYAFVSPSTNDLQSTFTTIANQLNSLYIVY